MNSKFREAFSSIHAEAELKEHTRDYLSRTVYRREKSFRRPAIIAAAVCLLITVFAGETWIYMTPTAYISIDINPSLELGINRFDRVVSVEGFNDDGRTLADTLDIKYLDYNEALEQLLSQQIVEDYLTEDALMSVTVSCSDEEKSSEILQDVESCTSGRSNVHCHSGDVEELLDAHSEGLSLGKYRAYLELKELDPSVTEDEIRDLSMREIQDLIDQYSSQTSSHESDSHGHKHGSEYCE